MKVKFESFEASLFVITVLMFYTVILLLGIGEC